MEINLFQLTISHGWCSIETSILIIVDPLFIEAILKNP